MAQYNFSPSLLNACSGLSGQAGDPFRDPSTMSRTTASGFTDKNHLREEFEHLKMESFDTIQDVVELMEEDNGKQTSKALLDKQSEMVKLSKQMANLMLKMEKTKHDIKEPVQFKEPMTPPKSPNEELEDDIMSVLSQSTIRPNDSASILRPKRAGTQLTMYSGIRSSLIRGSEHDDIVGGYELNAEDHMIELDSINNIQKVYGLPKIFVDNRLNFLVHLHKPLQLMLTTRETGRARYPDANSLEKLTRFIDKAKGRHREPHHELLYQVLKATIDVRRKKFKANPFNLPIIEVGMHLDDQIVFMCISELYQEFKTLWFQSMKNVEPPHFANDYTGIFTETPLPKRQNPNESQSKKRRGSSSILGSILS
jgi:hypothetical protein